MVRAQSYSLQCQRHACTASSGCHKSSARHFTTGVGSWVPEDVLWELTVVSISATWRRSFSGRGQAGGGRQEGGSSLGEGRRWQQILAPNPVPFIDRGVLHRFPQFGVHEIAGTDPRKLIGDDGVLYKYSLTLRRLWRLPQPQRMQ